MFSRKLFAVTVIASAFVCIIAGISFVFFKQDIFDRVYPNAIQGRSLGAVFFETSSGEPRIWLQTETSWHYTYEEQTAKVFSREQKGFFNTRYTYLYDPVRKHVLHRWKESLPALAMHRDLFFYQGMVWIVVPDWQPGGPALFAVDPETNAVADGSLVLATTFPALTSGIGSLVFDQSGGRLVVKTRDGQEVVVFFDYVSQDESDLSLVGAAARKTLAINANDTVIPAVTDTVFINGALLLADAKGGLVQYDRAVEKTPHRLLTAVGLDGHIVWTVDQDAFLSPEMQQRLSPETAITLRAERYPGMIVLSVFGGFLDGQIGMVSMDALSGAVRWSVVFP